MKNILLTLILGILLIGIASGEIQSLGTAKQGDCITLKQSYSNSSYSNISAVTFPNKTTISNEWRMTKNGIMFNYSFCNTHDLGEYQIDGHTSVDGIDTNWGYDFEVTTTGYKLDTSKSIIIFIGLGIMLLIGILLFIFGIYTKGIIKVFSIGLAVLLIAFSFGYTINILNAGIGEYTGLIGSFNGLYFLITVLLSVGGIGLILFLIYVAFQYFNKLRGFRD